MVQPKLLLSRGGRVVPPAMVQVPGKEHSLLHARGVKRTGQIAHTQRTPLGHFQSIRTCPECQGEGKVIKDPCPQCRGKGKIRRNRKVEIKVPAGVDTGSRLRMSGEGEAGELGGPPGDLYIIINVKPHKYFCAAG